MASYQDLLDAIGRVRKATGDRDAWRSGLTGDDIAAACNALSPPSSLGAVLTKIVAGHPEAFLSGARPAVPQVNVGMAADAIRGAEAALAQQNSTAAQVDLQVVTAVLNAHAVNADGAAQLDRLQREVEDAVLSRSNLDTAAGARDFQRFLIGKLRDIRTVVDTAGLDATSKASLAAALASLYASVTPQPADPVGEQDQPRADDRPPHEDQRGIAPGAAPASSTDIPSPEPADPPPYEFGGFPDGEMTPAAAVPPPAAPAPALPAPAMAAPMPAPQMPAPAMAPAWGGGLPGSAGGGLPTGSLPDFPGPDPLPDRPVGSRERLSDAGLEDTPVTDVAPVTDDTEDPAASDPAEEPTDADPTAVQLPGGRTVSAPTAAVAAAMTAAIAGTPIPDAFRQQGIVVPPPGIPVAAPVDVAAVLPGDVGVLADRHALAVGDGEALLDGRIQPIADVSGPGFLGWLHPPAPVSETSTPQAPDGPALNRPPAETAPS